MQPDLGNNAVFSEAICPPVKQDGGVAAECLSLSEAAGRTAHDGGSSRLRL